MMRYKRRTSASYLNQLPGAVPNNEFLGLFLRHGEHLVMFERGTKVPGLVISAFLPSLHFNTNIKPGIHMIMGTIGHRLPKVARIYLERIEGGCGAVLAAARQQGFRKDSELSSQVLYLLDTPPDSHSHMLTINV